MPKFRTVSVEVDAAQWWPPENIGHDPSMVSHRKGNQIDPPDYLQVGDLYQFSCIKGMGDEIYLLEMTGGHVRVYPGDWIVTNSAGTKRICKPDAFALEFESIDPAIPDMPPPIGDH